MKSLRTGAIILAVFGMAGHALAETVCASAQDLTALQVATLQQELTVAALACENDDVSLYNSFVTVYQPDLIASDQALEAFFLRRDANNGTADYNAFKTRLANIFSARHASDTRSFCSKAEALFRDALTGKKKSLAAFALEQPLAVDANYTVCGESVKGGASIARAVAKEPDIQAAIPAPLASAVPPAPPGANVYARNEEDNRASGLVPPPENQYARASSPPLSTCTRMSNGYLDCYYGYFHYYRDPLGRFLPPPQASYRRY